MSIPAINKSAGSHIARVLQIGSTFTVDQDAALTALAGGLPDWDKQNLGFDEASKGTTSKGFNQEAFPAGKGSKGPNRCKDLRLKM